MLTLPSPPCHYHQSAHRPLSTLQKTCHPYPFTLHNPPITQRPPKAIHPPPIYQTFNSIYIIFIKQTSHPPLFIHSFIHSFRLFYIASSDPLLLTFAPDTARVLCRSFTPKRHRQQLREKDLPKVPTWRLERDSNPRPFGRKASNLQMSHHAQQFTIHHYGSTTSIHR